MAAEEPVYAFLERRAEEIDARLKAIRGEALALEQELSDVRAAAHALSSARPSDRPSAAEQSSMYLNMTIKELFVLALRRHFPKGAPSKTVRLFIQNGWGRKIQPNSLRPQLSRLVRQKLITVDDLGIYRAI